MYIYIMYMRQTMGPGKLRKWAVLLPKCIVLGPFGESFWHRFGVIVGFVWGTILEVFWDLE